MSKIKRVIPFAENELYYSGYKNIILGFIYSFLGVLIYAYFLKKIDFDNLDFLPLIIVFTWVLFSCIILFLMKSKMNVVIFRRSKVMHCPCLAKVFLFLCYVFTGTYCSLFFDSMTTATTALELKAFMWSSLCMIISILGFGKFSVKEIKQID